MYTCTPIYIERERERARESDVSINEQNSPKPHNTHIAQHMSAAPNLEIKAESLKPWQRNPYNCGEDVLNFRRKDITHGIKMHRATGKTPGMHTPLAPNCATEGHFLCPPALSWSTGPDHRPTGVWCGLAIVRRKRCGGDRWYSGLNRTVGGQLCRCIYKRCIYQWAKSSHLW